MNRAITIAGGGLAGLALGISLRRHDVPVTLLEAGAYPRHRVCGEFLCGVGEETLAALGIGDLLTDAPQLTEAAWYREGVCVLRHDLPVPGRGVSRHSLDHRLALRLWELGGTLQVNHRLLPEHWTQPGTVIATGRMPDPKSELIGLKRHLRNLTLESGLEMHCAPGGYIGLCAVEGERVNASALFRVRPEIKGPREELQRQYLQACGFHGLVARMDQATSDPASCAAVSGVPSGRLPRRTGMPLLCSVGDRFGMIGPFTGNGMSMAFESAEIATAPLVDYARGRLDWDGVLRRIHRDQAQSFTKRLTLSAILHRTLLHPAGLPLLAGLGRHRLLPIEFLFQQLR